MTGADGARPAYVFAHHGDFAREWPFVGDRLRAGLAGLGAVQEVICPRDRPLSEVVDLGGALGIALFGGQLTRACLLSAPRLRALAVNTDNTGHGLPLTELWARGVAVIDTTAAWGQSVAECAVALAIGALRHIPQWHMRLAAGEALWHFPHAQYCDDPRFVAGDLGARRVGVLGAGQIGGRIARFCHALGSDVAVCDPHAPPTRLAEIGARRCADPDELVEHSEVLFVAVPPAPGARALISAERIDHLARGSLVVLVTRAHAVDMHALRRRVLADELAAALDVYDIEPLPPHDPLRGRDNVVHTPHIAGRTRDSNHRTADLAVLGFRRVLAGQQPEGLLTPAAVAVRTGEA